MSIDMQILRPYDDAMNISEQVRIAIKQCGVKSNRLAKLAGVDTAVLWRFLTDDLNERRTITMETLDKLAPVLGLSILTNKAKARQLRKLAAELPSPGRPPLPTPMRQPTRRRRSSARRARA
jgi:transcriptional regulator with XRE-family HTH domain